MIVRELLNKIGFKVDEAGLRRAEQRVKAVARNMESVGKRLSLAVTLPITAIGIGLIKAASDAEETSAKFGTVFRNISDDANATAEDLRRNFGLSSNAAKELLGDTGDLLTGFGFTQKSALDLSGQVNRLAVDLASFTNFQGGAEGASRALTKALLGERESVKLLGISILEEDVKRKIQMLRMKGITFATTRQAKAQATLLIAQEQSKNAIGDFARTSQGFANQTRILRGRLNDLAVSFGNLLLPAATKIVGVLTKLLLRFTDLDTRTKKIILIIGAFAASIGPALLALALLIKSFFLLKTAYGLAAIAANFFNVSVLALPLVILAIAAAVVALGVALYLFVEDIIVWVKGGESAIGNYLGSWVDFKDKVIKVITGLWQDMKLLLKLFLVVISGFVPDSIKDAWGDLVEWFSTLFGKISALFKEKLGKIFDVTGKLIGKAKGLFGKAGDAVAPIVQGAKGIARGIASGEGFLSDDMERGLIMAASGAGGHVIGSPESMGRKSGITSQQINIRSDIKLEIPAGTPESQVQFLEENARRVYAEENDKMIRNVQTNNQEVEE